MTDSDPIGAFIGAIAQLHLAAGKPSVRDIEKACGTGKISHSTVNNVLRGPKLAQLEHVLDVVRCLASRRAMTIGLEKDERETEQKQLVKQFHELWMKAKEAEDAGTEQRRRSDRADARTTAQRILQDAEAAAEETIEQARQAAAKIRQEAQTAIAAQSEANRRAEQLERDRAAAEQRLAGLTQEIHAAEQHLLVLNADLAEAINSRNIVERAANDARETLASLNNQIADAQRRLAELNNRDPFYGPTS